MKHILLVAMSILAFHTTGAQSRADLILLNGKVWTVNPKQAEAEAVACIGNRIVAVGSTNEIKAWAGQVPVSSIWRANVSYPGSTMHTCISTPVAPISAVCSSVPHSRTKSS